jgi:hypothetical protein
MKTLTLFILQSALLAAVALHPRLLAQDVATNSVEGVWKWAFAMPDGSRVTPRLELRQKNGQLTGTTRVRQGTDTAITNLSLRGDQIRFQVVRERDGREVVTGYQGTWSGNNIKGKITSNWSGTEQSYDWDARRVADVNGVWKWNSSFGGRQSEYRLTLTQDGEKLTGKLNPPRGADSEIKQGKFQGGDVSFEVEREFGGETFVTRYYGKFSGDKITGKSEGMFFGQPRTNTWEAVRVD